MSTAPGQSEGGGGRADRAQAQHLLLRAPPAPRGPHALLPTCPHRLPPGTAGLGWLSECHTAGTRGRARNQGQCEHPHKPRSHTHRHTGTHVHTHTHTHPCTLTCVLVHTHTHAHSLMHSHRCFFPNRGLKRCGRTKLAMDVEAFIFHVKIHSLYPENSKT